jgi:hypothetical protein
MTFDEWSATQTWMREDTDPMEAAHQAWDASNENYNSMFQKMVTAGERIIELEAEQKRVDDLFERWISSEDIVAVSYGMQAQIIAKEK